MVDITLFELDAEDVSFSMNAPFSGTQSEDEEPAATAEAERDGPSRLLLGALALGVAGVVVWWLRKGSVPEIDEEIEVTA